MATVAWVLTNYLDHTSVTTTVIFGTNSAIRSIGQRLTFHAMIAK
jgi:hypothetical protein